ncbi:MAG: hypothetical protein ACOYN0_08885 [Phycisphaerales bacterium]
MSKLYRSAALAALSVAASIAGAQSLAGNFEFADRGVGMQSFWNPASPSRIQHTGGSNILRVDENDNGSFNDAVDSEYVLPLGLEDGINYELSPTKDRLYVTLDGTFTCGGLLVHFLELPPGGGAANPTHQDCLPGGLPFNGASPEYFDTHHFGVPPPGTYTSPQRVAWMVTGANSGTPTPEVRFYDLTSPTVVASVVMSAQWNWIKIARSGNFALIKHDTDNPVGRSDYILVNLCSGPSFGTVVQRFQDVQGIPTEANARLVGISGGQLRVELFRGTQAAFDHVDRPDCLVPPTEEPGRCCIGTGCQFILPSACASLGGTFTAGANCTGSPCAPTGACCVGSSCSTQTLAGCNTLGGTWSQGAACTPTLCVPPAPQLTLSGSGSPTGAWQQPITYTFSAGNTGNASATNCQLVVFPPNGAAFVSATPAPSSSGFGEVRWNLGAIAAGSNRTITLTVNAPCNAPTATLFTYYMQASNAPFVNGAPQINTTLASESADPATISLSSVIPPAPLGPGAVSTHTITVTNDSSLPRTLYVPLNDPGNSAEFVDSLTPDVGTWILGPTYLSWNGDFAPGETKQIAFTTRIIDCILPTQLSTALNDGAPVPVRSSCGINRGTTAAPATVGLLRPISVAMGVPPVPGSVSPVVNNAQILSSNGPFTIDLSVTNNLAVSYLESYFSLTIPESLIVADPPFVGNPPPGLTYDSGSRTISYFGALAPGTLSFSIVASGDPAGPCSHTLALQGGSSFSCSDLNATLRLYTFGGLPAENTLLMLADGTQLYSWDPVTEAEPRRLGCLPGDGRSFSRAPDGRLFFTGSIDYMFDPATLTVTELMPIIRPQVGPEADGPFFLFQDLVWDETAERLYLLAMNYSLGRGTIVQFDPATNVANRVITRGDFAYRYEIEVDAIGRPIVPLFDAGRRVDPTQPLPLDSANAQLISGPVPAYGFPLGAQYRATRAFVARPDGGLLTLNTASWSSSGTQNVTWNLFSLAQSNAADVFTIVEPQLAWSGSSFPGPLPPRPVEFTPVIDPALFISTRLLNVDQNRALLLDYRAATSTTTVNGRLIDLSSGTSVTTLFPTTDWPFILRDVMWIKGPATCPADWDGVNGVDGDDVIAFFADWDVSNADFNNDGGTDGDDVIAFFARWDGGC